MSEADEIRVVRDALLVLTPLSDEEAYARDTLKDAQVPLRLGTIARRFYNSRGQKVPLTIRERARWEQILCNLQTRLLAAPADPRLKTWRAK